MIYPCPGKDFTVSLALYLNRKCSFERLFGREDLLHKLFVATQPNYSPGIVIHTSHHLLLSHVWCYNRRHRVNVKAAVPPDIYRSLGGVVSWMWSRPFLINRIVRPFHNGIYTLTLRAVISEDTINFICLGLCSCTINALLATMTVNTTSALTWQYCTYPIT